MNHISGMGGFTPSARLKKIALNARGKRALASVNPESGLELIQRVHKDSDTLRKFAERFAKKKRPNRDSVAKFELDQVTGKISVNIYDVETGRLEMKLSPEEVAEGLKHLEGSDDNEAPLSSFFIDIKV